ncbi:MAG: hypothetical protein HN353_14180 [Bdellovibrionales bacterium]|nr:hypothetical protein [Bdellovibrionales bacterium]MBT3527011.1 hypothetical protein [Bdellovibrionales bacterium]MBT7669516.1 hypothetical protein [Bdellovibrionales bacterium]MBT7765778.1 hypothetical protein [Bdellovibrionales bacterium]
MKYIIFFLLPGLFFLSCSHSPYPVGDVNTKNTPYIFTKSLLTMDAKHAYVMFSPKVTSKLKMHQLKSIQRTIHKDHGKLVKFVTEKSIKKNITSVFVMMERRAMTITVVEDTKGLVSGFGWSTDSNKR